jgi:hypothetical protein
VRPGGFQEEPALRSSWYTDSFLAHVVCAAVRDNDFDTASARITLKAWLAQVRVKFILNALPDTFRFDADIVMRMAIGTIPIAV